jgi:hypothetical protein
MLTNWRNFFSLIHDHLVLFVLAVAGTVPAFEFVVSILLRAYGNIFEECCNVRRRITEARKRLRQEIGSG